MTTVTATTDSELLVVDSSGWLEYLTGEEKADLFALYFEGERILFVPAIVLYEVRKILLLRESKALADIFVSEALRRVVVPVSEAIALTAAVASIDHHLAMADAIIYATAQYHRAQLITSDTHFANLAGVTLL
jgi:toxin FitB